MKKWMSWAAVLLSLPVFLDMSLGLTGATDPLNAVTQLCWLVGLILGVAAVVRAIRKREGFWTSLLCASVPVVVFIHGW